MRGGRGLDSFLAQDNELWLAVLNVVTIIGVA